MAESLRRGNHLEMSQTGQRDHIAMGCPQIEMTQIVAVDELLLIGPDVDIVLLAAIGEAGLAAAAQQGLQRLTNILL